MKKTILIVTLVVLALGALGVGTVLAQGQLPPSQGRGYGPMHDYVEQALAKKLGITEDAVEKEFSAGKPMYQIALDHGIKQADLAAFMNDVHKEAFANAVKAGVITQQQADLMLQHMQNRGGYGIGNCPMSNGQGAQFGRGNGYGPGMMGRGNGYGPGMMNGWQNP